MALRLAIMGNRNQSRAHNPDNLIFVFTTRPHMSGPSGLPPLSAGDWSLGSPKPSPMFVVCRRLDSGESDESFVETSTNLGSIMDLFRVGVGVVANLVEYLVGPLRLGLKDSNGYVRMVAAIGAFKLYHISARDLFKDFMNLLEDRLHMLMVLGCLGNIQGVSHMTLPMTDVHQQGDSIHHSLQALPQKLTPGDSLAKLDWEVIMIHL
ncbi:hypothetical protein Syun_018279 [Stephania yunnanensis]|uniref:Condensin complex subunit 1 C-terminal domain-containing protein n=1 Tax=Stephania yunnanensis TaxID=152371 RepID=A0AAP0ITV7_9MAGN